MADARRGKQKRKQRIKDERDKPSKEEYAVGKFLRFNETLNKDGKFLGNNSHYFLGSKAIDVLLESKWAPKSGKKDPLFTTRSACEAYLERLLEKGFFFRVQKLEKRDKKRRTKDGSEKKTVKEETPSSKKEKKSKKDKEEPEPEKEKEVDVKDGNDKDVKSIDPKIEKSEKQKEEVAAQQSEERKRRKKRAKLEMHDLQVFIDGPELYVWMYDPVPAKTFIIGLLLVLGAIGVCLFPLWPPEVRLGVYYLSIAAACFVGVIIGLCVVRIILFAIVWAISFGKISFWLLPNLTEDVGFFDSFRPLYKYDVYSSTATAENVQQKSEGNDDDTKNGDEQAETVECVDVPKENAAGGTEEENENVDEDEEDDNDDVNVVKGDDVQPDEEQDDDEDGEGRKSGSSSNDNGYEIVDANEVENVGAFNDDLVEDVSGMKSHEEPPVRHRKGKKTPRKEM